MADLANRGGADYLAIDTGAEPSLVAPGAGCYVAGMDGTALDPTLERAIIVIGAPRSGTTMLANLLSAHPDLAYLEEPRLTWRYGNDSKSDLLRPADARPEVLRHVRGRFADAVRAAGRRRLLEKSPSNSLRMGFVERVLPGCLFIHVVRDGVDSVLSIRKFWELHAHGLPVERLGRRWRELDLLRAPHYAREVMRRAMPRAVSGWFGAPAWGPRIPGLDGLLRDLELLEVCCLQWRMCVEEACHHGRALPPGRYLEIRLEDLSPSLIDEVQGFCGLAPHPAVAQRFSADFDRAQLDGRRHRIEPRDLETIERWTGPTRRWLGQSAG
jgi:hypothetical protein